jgi:tetratricopeptide (TPR) repeat protein
LAIYQEIDAPYLQGSALDNLGLTFDQLGRHDDAREHLQRALKLALGAANRDLQVEVLNSLGENALSTKEPARALEYTQQALAISEETGLRVGQARAHDVIGRAHRDLGDIEAARHHWNQALATYSTLGIPEAEHMRQLLETS